MSNVTRELKKRIGFSKINFPAKFLKSGAGFTLIEIVITIAVIGILAVGITNIIDPVTQLQKARDAQRKSDLSQIQKALEVYHQDNGKYPDAVSYMIKNLNEGGNAAVMWGTSWVPYMSILPKDPNFPLRNYLYNSTSNGQTYYLYVSLERGSSDPQACNGGEECKSVPQEISSCGNDNTAVCNYGVSTPNVSP